MALPIQPTPVLTGADAERLLASLADVCTPEEARSRVEWARAERARERLSAEETEKLKADIVASADDVAAVAADWSAVDADGWEAD